jgi:hypothetical protein
MARLTNFHRQHSLTTSGILPCFLLVTPCQGRSQDLDIGGAERYQYQQYEKNSTYA